MQISAGVYRPRRPETAALYEIVRDNLETLYGATFGGAIAVRISKHARKELEAYLDCGQPSQVTRLFRRLHAHGLIAKIPRSRRWRVSLAGRRTMSTAIKLREVAYPALFAAAA